MGTSIRTAMASWLCTAILPAAAVFAQAESPDAQHAVLARVGGESIYASDVARLLGTVTRDKQVNPAMLPALRSRLLRQIVDRRLVLSYARRTNSGASRAEVDAALAELESQFALRGRSLDEVLQERAMGKAHFRRRITWDLTWKKYLRRYVTESRLASYFDAHRRECDGTQLAVSHILLRPAAGADSAATAALVERAESIRRAIVSGETSFAEAAARHSAGPSRAGGGRLGLISRHGSMEEAFARAAFALQAGQVSRPVRTRFGVHLIRCDRIEPGDKQMPEVRPALKEALSRELLGKLARLERRYTKVEFTVPASHRPPATKHVDSIPAEY